MYIRTKLRHTTSVDRVRPKPRMITYYCVRTRNDRSAERASERYRKYRKFRGQTHRKSITTNRRKQRDSVIAGKIQKKISIESI